MAKKSTSTQQKENQLKRISAYERARSAYARHVKGGAAHAMNVRIGGEQYADDIAKNFLIDLQVKARAANITLPNNQEEHCDGKEFFP